MIGLDCNILVQLTLADHSAHSRTSTAVQSEMQAGIKLIFPSLVATEFLHVITDKRRFAPALTMTEALDWMRDLLVNPSIRLLEPNQASMAQTILWMRQYNLGRKRILDTHLAAILHTNGVRRLLTANPSDFKVFEVIEIVTP